MTEQQALPSDPTADSSQLPDDLRTEIQSRVAGYRHRRGRRIVGAFSMRFPFPPAQAEESTAPPEKEVGEVCPANPGAEDGCCAEPVTVAEPVETIDLGPVSPQVVAVASEQPETAIAPGVRVADADSCLPEVAAEPDPMPAPVPVTRPRGKRKII